MMPMMQFSVAPWRILNKENLETVSYTHLDVYKRQKYKIENDGSYTLAKQVMFHTPGGVLSLCVDPEYVWIGANEGLFQVCLLYTSRCV